MTTKPVATWRAGLCYVLGQHTWLWKCLIDDPDVCHIVASRAHTDDMLDKWLMVSTLQAATISVTMTTRILKLATKLWTSRHPGEYKRPAPELEQTIISENPNLKLLCMLLFHFKKLLGFINRSFYLFICSFVHLFHSLSSSREILFHSRFLVGRFTDSNILRSKFPIGILT